MEARVKSHSFPASAAAALSTFLIVFLVHSPRASATVAALGAVAALGWLWRDPAFVRQHAWPTPEAWALYAFACFAFISTLWSYDKLESASKPLFLALLIAGAQSTILVFSRQPENRRMAVGKIILATLIVGIALTAFESISNQWLSRKAYTIFPWLYRGLEGHVRAVDGIVTSISETNIKRRIGLFTLLICPAALLLARLAPRQRRAPALVGFVGLAGIMVYTGPHQSSWVAGLLGVATLGLALRSRKAARSLLQIGFSAWVLLALPLVWAAHEAELHKANWIPNSARHRIVIWNATANEVLRSPIIGVGANATRKIFEDREAIAPATERDDGTFIIGLTRHAHNAYVQIWFELGLIGALLFALAGVAIVRGLDRLPHWVQPFGYAQFSATAAIMSSSYGIWQMWFLASIAMGAVAFICAACIQYETPANTNAHPA